MQRHLNRREWCRSVRVTVNGGECVPEAPGALMLKWLAEILDSQGATVSILQLYTESQQLLINKNQ